MSKKIEDKKIADTYGIKEQIGYMIPENKKQAKKYCSALVFGPPGTGKSTIGKYLAKKLSEHEKTTWNYIEIQTGQFLDKGEDKIIPQANEIFLRLSQIKKAVVFFDVDQLVKSRQRGGPVWIVTALLPEFAELRKQKDVRFLLATNVSRKKEDSE